MKVNSTKNFDLILLFFFSAVFVRLNAQTESVSSSPPNSRYQCRNSGSYNLESPVQTRPAYGPPQKKWWFQKLFPFLFKYEHAPKSELPITKFERLYSRPLAVGESKRSEEMRAESQKKLLELKQSAERTNEELRLETINE